ncbi:MAG: sulfurtransferase-like selenium metabolism protein YedF [Actinobacteria bacterium]|nr:sulfurtransferase-like selenium metabolism protein YedF [Actinomycetota bacterium]
MKTPDIDARGLECPGPVLETKKMLSQTDGRFTVLVDNEAARDNVSRFAVSSGCTVDMDEVDGCFLLAVTPGKTAARPKSEKTAPAARNREKIIFVSSDELGQGDGELGETLMKSFLYACTENDDTPSKFVFMNAGVKLVTVNEDTIEHLQDLEEKDVELLVCGTCLDFYGLKENLRVGRISNMYEIQSALIGADVLICL